MVFFSENKKYNWSPHLSRPNVRLGILNVFVRIIVRDLGSRKGILDRVPLSHVNQCQCDSTAAAADGTTWYSLNAVKRKAKTRAGRRIIVIACLPSVLMRYIRGENCEWEKKRNGAGIHLDGEDERTKSIPE